MVPKPMTTQESMLHHHHTDEEATLNQTQKPSEKGAHFSDGANNPFLRNGTDEKIAVPANLLEDVVGCGPFQWMIVAFVSVMTKLPSAATFMFMSFGNYNPGWRCLDNNSSSSSSSSNSSSTIPNSLYHNGNGSMPIFLYNHSTEYSIGSCDAFDSCQNIEFNPDTSTIVTEWGLVCNRSWISPIIISVQMVGGLIGSVVAGQLGDMFGRKTMVYGCVAAIAVFNFLSVLSSSWQMFAAIRFFLGIAASSHLVIFFTITNEFIPSKWRGPNAAIPSWNIGAIIFSVVALMVRDWKYVHLATGILSVLCFLPVFWVPESARWLAVKQKQRRFNKVVETMTRLNGKKLPSDEVLEEIVKKSTFVDEGSAKNFGINHLFHPGFKMYTVLISLAWMSCSIIYYAITFGVKSMYGDFYINLILSYSLEIPFAIFQSFVPNLFGRAKGSVLLIFLSALFILAVTGLDQFGGMTEKEIGSIFLLLAKVSMNGGWCVLILITSETYPTVVRGVSIGWGYLMARIGGIIGPFIIPDNPDDFYIAYIAMATLAIFCCAVILRIPETKGKPLRDTFDEGVMTVASTPTSRSEGNGGVMECSHQCGI